MAYNTIALRTRDSESDTKYGALYINLPATMTLGGIQTWVTAAIPIVEGITAAKVVEADAKISLSTAASGNAVPTTGVYNERGCNFLFDTSGQKNFGVFMPAILHSLLAGTLINVADGDVVEDFVNMFITGLNDGTGVVAPVTDAEEAFVSAIRGKKGFRRK